MSHSTLNDFYNGMKMPKYDGQNVMAQLQQLAGTTSITVTKEVTIEQTKTTEGKYANNQSFGK
jgi:hypothetical protein